MKLDKLEKVGLAFLAICLLGFGFRSLADSPTIFGPSSTSTNIQPNLKLDRHLILKNPSVGSFNGVPMDMESGAEAPWTATFPSGPGTNGQVLTTDGAGILSWGSGSSAPSGTGSVIFNTAGALNQDNANFFWDNTNKMLGLGLAAPTATLQVRGPGSPTAAIITDGNGHYAQEWWVSGGMVSRMDEWGRFWGGATFGGNNFAAVNGVTNGTDAHIIAGGMFQTTGASCCGPLLLYNGTSDGKMIYMDSGGSSGNLQIKMANSGNWAWTWPPDAGTAGGLLKTNGSGVSTWTSEVTVSNPERLHIGAGAATSAPTDLYVSGSAEFGSSVLFDSYIEVTSSLKVDDVGGSGGNVPHQITRRSSATATSATCAVTCNANEIALGGGCTNSAGVSTQNSSPTADDTWSCVYLLATGTCTAWAVCAQY